MHVFLGDVYVRSFKVALGAEGKTPTGKWRVTSRQANPSWVDPQTGKRYHADDPANPIGEYWVGLEGLEGAAVGAFGYGIHGTNEPQTIGRDVSLGCIRLAPDDIEFVYKLLLPGASFVTTTE
jgi:lipoprotein-anchoring transpeptidase ErfK/SrfK